MQNKLNRGFSQLREDELDNKAQFIITSLTGNAPFAGLAATIATVQTALDAYRAALARDDSGRIAAITATRDDLETKLGQLAGSCELTPGVTDAQLATTGFDLRKPRTTTDAPVDAPGNARVKATGINGQVQVLCDPVDRARSYQVQKGLDGATWTDVGTFGSTRGILINSLERGKDIWVRVRAVGGNGPGAWGDPATTMVT